MKKFASLVLTLIFVLALGIVSFATGTISTQTVTPTQNGEVLIDSPTGQIQTGINNMTINEASSWFERKGYDVVSLLKTIAQPFAVIVFIICAFLTLIGAFGNSQLVGRGILGMFIAVIMYAVVLYADDILQFTLNWMKS